MRWPPRGSVRNAPRTLLTRRVDFSIYRHSFLGLNHLKYKAVDHIVAISDAIRRVLVEDGLDADGISTVPSGIDPERFKVEPCDLHSEFDLPAETTIVTNVAFFADHKGQEYLVRAAPLLLAAHEDCAVFLFGEGDLKEPLEDLARELDVAERVFFPGFRRDVPAILRGSDVYAMPSHMEGLGTSILDALWCELPVVAARAGGIPEIVHDGHNGFLVEPKNPEALAEALGRLVGDPVTRKRMGGAGPTVVSSKYTVDRMVEGNIAVYENMLS